MSTGQLPWTLPIQIGGGPTGNFTGHGASTATASAVGFNFHGGLIGHGTLTANASVSGVHFDAVGGGDGEFWAFGGPDGGGNYFSSFLYWTHDAAPGACVVATVVATGGSAVNRAPVFLAKYGQTPMQLLGQVPLNNVPGNGILAMFVLEDVPGPATITIDINPAQTPARSTRNGAAVQAFVNWYMAGVSTSYTNVAPILATQVSTVYGTGTSLSQSLTASSGQMLVQAFANRGAGTMSGTFRSQATTTPPSGQSISVYTSVGISDAAVSTGFSASVSASDAWAGVGIVLKPCQSNGAYLRGRGQLSVKIGATPVENLTDAFAFADTTKWTFHGGATVSGGQLQLVPTPSGSYIVSNQRYSMFNSAMGAKLVTPPNVGNGGTETYICLTEDLTFQNCVKAYWNNGSIYFTQTVDGVTSTPFALEGIEEYTGHGYTAGDYIQIYADMGMYWPLGFNFWNPFLVNVGDPRLWSASVQTGNGPPGPITPGWVNADTGCAQINVTNLYVVIGADYTGTEPSPGVAIWENANVYPANPKTSTIIDDFSGGRFADPLWNWSLSQDICSVSNNQLLVPAFSGGAWITSMLCYDLRESSISLELVQTLNEADQAHNASILCLAFYAQSGCWDKGVAWELVNNALCARNYWASDTESVCVPFSSETRFVRIRESLGVFYWDTSPDSVTWTNQRKANLGWRPYSVCPNIDCTTFGSGTSGPQTMIVDKLNVATTVDPSAVLSGTGTLSATTVVDEFRFTGPLVGHGRLSATAAETGGFEAKLPWVLPVQLGSINRSAASLAGHGALSAGALPAHVVRIHGHGALSASVTPPGSFVVAADWTSQGEVEGTAIFYPVPASSGGPVAVSIIGGQLSTFLPAAVGNYLVEFAGVTLNGVGGSIEGFEFASVAVGHTLNLMSVASPPPLVVTGVTPPNAPANSAVWSAASLTLSHEEEKLAIELDDDWLITTDKPWQASERRKRLLTANAAARPSTGYAPVTSRHRDVHGTPVVAPYAAMNHRDVAGEVQQISYAPVTSLHREVGGDIPGPDPYPHQRQPLKPVEGRPEISYAPVTSLHREVHGDDPLPDPYPHQRQPLKSVEEMPQIAYEPVTSARRDVGGDDPGPDPYAPVTSKSRNTIRVRERRRRVKQDG